MRVLIVHNRYQQRGGEDGVVAIESELLRTHGHAVEVLLVNNDHIQGGARVLTAALSSMYSVQGQRLVADAIRSFQPDIVHVHNFFPTLSPAVFRTCTELGVPVVHTLHNYRTVCAASTLFREGRICEDCIEQRSMLPGVKHACYRGSRVGSAVSGADMLLHQLLGTWNHHITSYIALTEFAADTLGRYRIPRAKIHIKANSADDLGVGDRSGDFALFLGRFTEEKGVPTLLHADREGLLPMDVIMIGEGPLRSEVEAAVARPGSRLKTTGFLEKQQIRHYMQQAVGLVLPSIWYEAGPPLVVLEAFSAGLPVIAADQANLRSVFPPAAGKLFAPGDPRALADGLRLLLQKDVGAAMAVAARKEYLRAYTSEINYQALLRVYQNTLALHRNPGVA